MAHPLLDAADVGLGDHARPERVAQVVKAQRPKPARPAPPVAAPQRRAVEVAAELAGEHQIVVAGRKLALAELREASATSGAIGTERTFPDFGVVSAPPE